MRLARKSLSYSITFLVVAVVGCGQTPPAGPSYADLVVTYNAELEALDRLETRREKLASEYAAAIRPPSDGFGSLGQLEGLVEAAKQLQSEGGIDPSGVDPNALLDQLAERGNNAGDLAGQLLEGLTGESSTGTESGAAKGSDADGSAGESVNVDSVTVESVTVEQAAAMDELRAKFEPQIAALDKEIAEQKGRVERAKVARDAAEAKSSE